MEQNKRGMVYHPYKKVWVDRNSEEGKKLKRLIANCKKCLRGEVYDDVAQKCVKIDKRNKARLGEVIKFCQAYRREKIKLKKTDKFLFGKVINFKLPGGDYKLRDIIGDTKIKEVAYEIEKENKSAIKLVLVMLPILATITGLAVSNPMIFSFLKENLIKLSSGNKFFTNLFSKALKSSKNVSGEMFIPGKDNLKVNLEKNDNITKDRIEKDRLGSFDPQTSLATVNTNKLGIKGIYPYTDLVRYTLRYVPENKRYVLSKKDIFSSESGISGSLKDIVVDFAERKSKVNNFENRIKSISQKLKKIKTEKEVIVSHDNIKEVSDKNLQKILDIEERIQNLESQRKKMYPKTVGSIVNQINRLTNEVKVLQQKRDSATRKLESIEKDNASVFLKFKNKLETINMVQKMIASYAELKILLQKMNETNVNALDPILEEQIDKLDKKIEMYNGMDIANIG